MDDFIDQILPHLEKGDIIIDGGNSEYQDTDRRTKSLKEKGILFVGSGVSGGEEGARYGPSLMPGGNPDAWPHIKAIFQVWNQLGYDTLLFLTLKNWAHKITDKFITLIFYSKRLQSIAAKVGTEPCCDWVGEAGSGHFVKMVHNGIEYGDMQLICEAYHLLKDALGLSNDELSEVWMKKTQLKILKMIRTDQTFFFMK